MSYTIAEYVEAIWSRIPRTLSPGTPPAPDGTYIDAVAHAVWEYPNRTTTSGGGAVISVAESMPVPAQNIGAESAGINRSFLVAESHPAPTQAIGADSGQTKKKSFGNAGVAFYPPVYPIPTRGRESMPLPQQFVMVAPAFRLRTIQFGPRPSQVSSATLAILASIGQESAAPTQGGTLKSLRAATSRVDEEQFILALLGVS